MSLNTENGFTTEEQRAQSFGFSEVLLSGLERYRVEPATRTWKLGKRQ